MYAVIKYSFSIPYKIKHTHSLLVELMVLFRTKRFFSLWQVNRWTSNLQEKILIQKLQALHIFARLCSVSVGSHPHFSFPQNDLKISSTKLSWKQSGSSLNLYALSGTACKHRLWPSFTNPLCVLYNVYCFTQRNEVDNVKYRVKSVIRYPRVPSKRDDKQYIST